MELWDPTYNCVFGAHLVGMIVDAKTYGIQQNRKMLTDVSTQASEGILVLAGLDVIDGTPCLDAWKMICEGKNGGDSKPLTPKMDIWNTTHGPNVFFGINK